MWSMQTMFAHIVSCGMLAAMSFISHTAVATDVPISPTWKAMSGRVASEVFEVVEYLHPVQESRFVVLRGGRAAGVVAGTTFKAYRLASGGAGTSGASKVWVTTGRLKAVDVQDAFTVATVEEQGSEMSRAFFPKFPEVMAGDLAVMHQITLSRRQAVLPTQSISYFDLFEDPKADPRSFELRADGMAKLKEAAMVFADARTSMLMVEGYTDHHGPSQANQIESYQRALTVRQYLIDELGFDPNRVLAVGYGESEPADQSQVPGYIEANRRIVLKAVPSRGTP